MRAVRCSDRRAVVSDVPAPSGEGVLVEVVSAGICGSDLHMIDAFPLEVTLGHEVAGLLPDGRPVAVEPLAPCWECSPCRSGDYNRCVLGPATVLGVGLDGGMAERCLVPETALVPLPTGLPLSDACLVEPLAVAVHGVRRISLAPGERVAVVGGGAVGLCAVIAAQAAGASVDVVARHDHQKEAAERLGAGLAGEGAGGYDAVFEAAGTSDALGRAVELCAPGGRIGILGTYWQGDVQVPGLAIGLNEISLVPCSMYGRAGPSRDIDTAAALLARRPEVAGTLITHRFPLDAAPEAFAAARDRAAGAIKVVLEP